MHLVQRQSAFSFTESAIRVPVVGIPFGFCHSSFLTIGAIVFVAITQNTVSSEHKSDRTRGGKGMAGGLGVWDLVWLEIWVGGDRGERAL